MISQKFSISESLMHLYSAIKEERDVSGVCRIIEEELNKICICQGVFSLRYRRANGTISVLGSTKQLSSNQFYTSLDESSISWIEKQDTRTMSISHDVSTLPIFMQDIANACKMNDVLVYAGSSDRDKRDLIAICGCKPLDKITEEERNLLLEFLRAADIIIEDVNVINEIKSMRGDIQSVFDLAPVGIVICDSDGNVLDANQQALLILGCGIAADTLIGENFLSSEDFKKSGIDDAVRKAIAGEDVDIENLRFKCSSGRVSYIHVRFKSTPAQNGDSRIIGVMADVTQRIRLQQQLERSYHTLTEAYQELQRGDKMKTRFIDTVSHELRTPLTVMRGYLELIQTEYADKIDPKMVSKLKTLKSNTERLYDLVESMLDVARIEQGAMEIIKQEASIKILVEEIAESQKHLATEKHQELKVVIIGDISLVKIDARKIRDAIRNILNNAIRYTPEGGKIQLGLADEGKMVHIWVRDNGVGIPTSDLEKIFDRFHIVVARELSHQVDRMGLGLPLAKGIVEAHGGKLWVESEIGKGSVFHINLPKQ